MTNPNFTPNYSTNEVWRGDDSERCLTDDLDAMDAIHESLPSTYAAINHTHTGYATSSDVAALQDALNNKANINHTHTGYAPSTHNHNDIYYTESEIDSKLSSKADSTSLTAHTNNSDLHVTANNKSNWNAAYTHSQSAHAPSNAEVNQNAFSNVVVGNTTIAADKKTDTLTFVAGNNVTITPSATNDSVTISATNTTYTHPTTAGNKHIPAGGSSGQILKWSSNGTAVWGNESGGGEKIVTTTGTGEAYIASVDGITALTPGISFIMIPHVTSAKTMPTLNVNGLGAKNVRMRVSNSTTTTTPLSSENMLVANKPIRVMYDGTQWIIGIVRPNVTNLYGTLTVEQGGTGGKTAAAARTNLDVYSKAEVENLIAEALEIGIQKLKNAEA